jgi:hypothetical protein
MSPLLLHIRTAVSLRHIEREFDDFEQGIICDAHYLLSREGKTANYVVIPDRPLDALHEYLVKHATGFTLEHLSLVEIGRPWRVIEQGMGETDDCCGEWSFRRNEESLAFEEVRMRTGLARWLERHARNAREIREAPTGLFLYTHSRQEPDSRWLSNFRGVLGNSSRPHMRDEQSVVLSWDGVNADRLFRENRFARYLEAPHVHTAFAFAIGQRERHTAGALQSMQPPFSRSRRERKMQAPAPTLKVVARSPAPSSELRSAMLKLKAAKLRRLVP